MLCNAIKVSIQSIVELVFSWPVCTRLDSMRQVLLSKEFSLA